MGYLTTLMSQFADFAEGLPWSDRIKSEATFLVTASTNDQGEYVDTEAFNEIFGTSPFGDYSAYYDTDSFPEETGSYDDYYATATAEDDEDATATVDDDEDY
ncbi:unnamed protein product [[Candida] boidinii]|nr:unnamed protein product [[Candida] boidinii]